MATKTTAIVPKRDSSVPAVMKKPAAASPKASAPVPAAAAPLRGGGAINGIIGGFVLASAAVIAAGFFGVIEGAALYAAFGGVSLLFAVASAAAFSRMNANIEHFSKFWGTLAGGDLSARLPLKEMRGERFLALAEQANGFVEDLDFNVREGFNRVAKGDIHIERAAGGQHDQVGQTLMRLSRNLGEAIEEVKKAGDAVVGSSSQISAAGDRISRNTESQASALDQIGASIDKFSDQVRRGKETMDSVAAKVASAKLNAEEGHVEMERLDLAVVAIEQSSRDISGIVQDLKEIADSINLLALNAAIEAARAGEAGKGFAVVADNVRTLSNKSQKLAKDAEAMIQNSLRRSQEGLEISKANHANIKEIVGNVSAIDALLQGAGDAAESQVTAITQITTAIRNLEDSSHSTLRSLTVTSRGAEHLLEEAMKLKAAVAKFHTRKSRIVIDGVRLEDETGNILWHDMLSVRHRKIDDQHRELVALINAVNMAKEPAVLQATLGRLVEYVKVHFTFEENTMRKGGFPDSDAHREMHESLLHQVGVITQHKLADRDLLLDFLKGWLVNHILGSDKKYTPYVQGQ